LSFLENEWRIIRGYVDASLIITGKRVDILREKISKKIYPGVQIENPPSNIVPLLRKADVLINPVRWGSGVSIKVIEALSAGRYVITTPEGARDINLSDEEGLGIYKNTDELLSIIDKVMDRKFRQRAGKKARAWALANHSVKSVIDKIKSMIGL